MLRAGFICNLNLLFITSKQLATYKLYCAFFLVKFIMRYLEQNETMMRLAQAPGWTGTGLSCPWALGKPLPDALLIWDYGIMTHDIDDPFLILNKTKKNGFRIKLLREMPSSTTLLLHYDKQPSVNHDLTRTKLSKNTVRAAWCCAEIYPITGVSPKYNHKNLHLKKNPQPREYMATRDRLQLPILQLTTIRHSLWCQISPTSNPQKRKPTNNEFTQYIPIVREKNIKYVHHIIMYQCHMPESEKIYDKFVKAKGAQCHSANMPVSWRACSTPLISWAVGSEGGFLPDHVGYPLGEEYGGANYFMLELHYNNPSFDAEVVDDSGLRIYHTDVLREHDAGTFVIGHSVHPMFIPPQRIWNTVGYCSSECTEQTIPSRGINVFSALLHTHLLGTRIKLRQIRDGKELPNILKDDNYDFNYQEARWLKPEMKILPGDFFLNECVYDSKSRPNITFGGFSTQEEMCITFLSYYPKINLAMCGSEPTRENLFDHFGIEELYQQPDWGSNGNNTDPAQLEDRLLARMLYNDTFTGEEVSLAKFLQYEVIKKPFHLQNKTFYDVLTNRSEWSNEKKVDAFQKIVLKDHKTDCSTMLGQSNGDMSTTKYPEFLPYTEPKPSCEPTGKCLLNRCGPPAAIMPSLRFGMAVGSIRISNAKLSFSAIL
ncbi:unnamed protein product, partial [Meganyctiphanes norvegica]